MLCFAISFQFNCLWCCFFFLHASLKILFLLREFHLWRFNSFRITNIKRFDSLLYSKNRKTTQKINKIYFICLFIYFEYCCCCCCCCWCVLAVAGHLFELSFEFLIHLQKFTFIFKFAKKQHQKHKILYTLYFRNRRGLYRRYTTQT